MANYDSDEETFRAKWRMARDRLRDTWRYDPQQNVYKNDLGKTVSEEVIAELEADGRVSLGARRGKPLLQSIESFPTVPAPPFPPAPVVRSRPTGPLHVPTGPSPTWIPPDYLDDLNAAISTRRGDGIVTAARIAAETAAAVDAARHTPAPVPDIPPATTKHAEKRISGRPVSIAALAYGLYEMECLTGDDGDLWDEDPVMRTVYVNKATALRDILTEVRR